MFGPQHLQHLIRYFDGIDSVLSELLLRKVPSEEPHLTNELCALLDADTQQREKKLSYSVEDLNRDLASADDGVDFEATLDTYPHNTAMERYVSQSDFGLVLSYDNRVMPELNWSAAWLVQAKRVFPNPATGEYDDGAKFRSVNSDQQQRLDVLAGVLGSDALLYGLYCPSTAKLPDLMRTKVRALHTFNVSQSIFDYAPGLALKDVFAANGKIDSGIWLHPTEMKPKGLIDLHSLAFVSAWPLSWFFVNKFSVRHVPGMRVPRPHTSPEQERVRKIVRGNEQAVRELIRELTEMGEKSEAPTNITVLPRHTITITATVGKKFEADIVRVRRD